MITVISLKFKQQGLTIEKLFQDADGMANSVDPNPLGSYLGLNVCQCLSCPKTQGHEGSLI